MDWDVTLGTTCRQLFFFFFFSFFLWGYVRSPRPGEMMYFVLFRHQVKATWDLVAHGLQPIIGSCHRNVSDIFNSSCVGYAGQCSTGKLTESRINLRLPQPYSENFACWAKHVRAAVIILTGIHLPAESP